MAERKTMKFRYQALSLLVLQSMFCNAYGTTPQDISSLYQLPKTTDSQAAVTGYSTAKSAIPVKHYDRWFPLLGDKAIQKGYDLPEPFGIGINYMNIRQNIDVSSINFTGLGLGNVALPSTMFKIDASKTRQYSKTRTLRLDAWVLPFWNIYGIVGKTRGHSVSAIGVDSDPGEFKGNVLDQLISNVVHSMHNAGKFDNLNFELKFKGTTYGVGTVLAGGVGNWYGLVDFNYTQTHFDILDGSINAVTVSPRVGYRFDTPGIRSIGLTPGKLNVWAGTMYQNVQQEFKGSLNDLAMPASLKQLMAMANRDGNGRFDVKQHLQSPWNILIGAQYNITRHFNISTEVGFAQRNSIFVSGEYRF